MNLWQMAAGDEQSQYPQLAKEKIEIEKVEGQSNPIQIQQPNNVPINNNNIQNPIAAQPQNNIIYVDQNGNKIDNPFENNVNTDIYQKILKRLRENGNNYKRISLLCLLSFNIICCIPLLLIGVYWALWGEGTGVYMTLGFIMEIFLLSLFTAFVNKCNLKIVKGGCIWSGCHFLVLFILIFTSLGRPPWDYVRGYVIAASVNFFILLVLHIVFMMELKKIQEAILTEDNQDMEK